MKIPSLTLHHISMPLVAPFETSFGRETDRECVIIVIQADGLIGYGECVTSREPGYNYETTGTAWHILKDFIAPLVPLGLAAGRLGNFINGELWGRVTELPWAVVFPQAGDALSRHPSQLYQFAGEGLLLFVILWWWSSRPRSEGAVSGAFLLGYAVFRSLAELAREPDRFLGFPLPGITMGQILCVPMMIAGIGLIALSRR